LQVVLAVVITQMAIQVAVAVLVGCALQLRQLVVVVL
jgi:hypothetical protein